MSTFVVSARKYRPNRFEDVVGQEHVSGTLKNALQTDHLAHAFLFCGPRGVGKTTCARILAKVLNCQSPTSDFEPCNDCESCKAFNKNASFNITELDAASNNSVEHIRALIEQVRFQPQQGKYKVFIIDEVHMLSQQAFNAFLKTLEEPPPYAIFILATTEKHKIIPTILSRCQIFDFRRIQVSDMVVHLFNICQQEGIEASPDALHIIGQKADGALRDALSIFDRIVAFAGKKISYEDVIANLNILDYDYYFRLVDAMLMENITEVMLIFDQVLRKGFDPELFINGLAEHLRNLLVCKDPETLQLLECGDGLRKRYQDQAHLSPTSLLLTALNLANECDLNYKMARNKRLHVELSLIKMTHAGRAFSLGSAAPQAAPANGQAQKKTPDLSESAIPTPTSPEKQVNTAETEQQSAPVADPEPEIEPIAASPEHQNGSSEVPHDATVTEVVEEEVPEPAEPAASVDPPVKNGKPEPAAANGRPGLKRSARHSLAHLNMDALLAEVEEDLEQQPQEIPELKLETIQQSFDDYIEQHDKNSVKMLLKNVKLDLEDTELVVKVGTRLAESSVREETEMMDYLRGQLKHPELSLRIEIDPSMVVEPPKRQKPLNAKDKYRLMNEVNPQIRELITRFGMRPDEE
ncbi:DNA polymerase III subunit gamma/tau [Flavilitoribacter nigricans]|uniref:DNA polymerase III subunit gamma/tau n=1 Tax=Flavilitoribacter nigricans (strain ATCC 23147 / DSM 23189 / NBRC 102662 / NCIMB 1420 / SS-2) TaxID=1122177 RepID=A0A2D0NG56_FLAN2|nr:DNA polymerase III subunit gamma/tau [Flavilitoribacter nigricans]PHN07398.1 DNA polymerase III subunit gamma/tau [Flavilitoribacter nigricans DSM 23189 = NBRC 102662]